MKIQVRTEHSGLSFAIIGLANDFEKRYPGSTEGMTDSFRNMHYAMDFYFTETDIGKKFAKLTNSIVGVEAYPSD